MLLSPEMGPCPSSAVDLLPIRGCWFGTLLYSPKRLSVRPGMLLWASCRLPGVPGTGKRRAELRNPAPRRHRVERTSSGRTHGPKEGGWDTALHFSPRDLTASCRSGGQLPGGERLEEEKQRSRELMHSFLLCLPPPALLAAGGAPLSLERIQLHLQATQQTEDIRGLETGFAIYAGLFLCFA